MRAKITLQILSILSVLHNTIEGVSITVLIIVFKQKPFICTTTEFHILIQENRFIPTFMGYANSNWNKKLKWENDSINVY